MSLIVLFGYFYRGAGNDLKGGVQDNVNQLSEQEKALQDQSKALQEGAGQLKQEGLKARDALKEGAGQIVQEGKQVGQEIKGNVMTINYRTIRVKLWDYKG